MNNNAIPPYVESIFHKVLGLRNSKISDFKITAMKGSPNPMDTSDNLQTILSDLASAENQLEMLVGMFPDLESLMAPTQQPQPQPQPQPEVLKQQAKPPVVIEKEDIEGEETALYEDGKVISSFKPSDLKDS